MGYTLQITTCFGTVHLQEAVSAEGMPGLGVRHKTCQHRVHWECEQWPNAYWELANTVSPLLSFTMKFLHLQNQADLSINSAVCCSKASTRGCAD